MPFVLLSFGGNTGNVKKTFARILADLAVIPTTTVVAVSSLHETCGVGLSGIPTSTFWNGAIALTTECSPVALLQAVQELEDRCGRKRILRWGDRPVDLDILFYDDMVLESPLLTVPHPGAWYRRFVLDPLVEIAPDFVHPIKQRSIRELRDRLLTGPISIGLAGPEAEAALAELKHWPDLAGQNIALWRSGDPDPKFLVWCGPSNDPRFELLPSLPRILPHDPATSPAHFVQILLASAAP